MTWLAPLDEFYFKPAFATASVLGGLPQGPPGRSPPSQALREGLQRPPTIQCPCAFPLPSAGTQISGHLLWARHCRAPPQPPLFGVTHQASDPSGQTISCTLPHFQSGAPQGQAPDWVTRVCVTRRCCFRAQSGRPGCLGPQNTLQAPGLPRARDGGGVPPGGRPLAG